jgi:hypothetical protein
VGTCTASETENGSFTIRCPICMGTAEFRFAILSLSDRRLSSFMAEMWPSAQVVRWGGWHVVQHDPNLYAWKPPPYGFRRSGDGIRMCVTCVGRFKHKLNWPADAYYRFEFSEGLLWAWSASL